ncbi:MAG: D-2-hydroxyacid dehydrogenase family protein [Alphaproteobacteria bacterium]
MLQVALLDDYARIAMDSADWSPLAGKAELSVFDVYLSEDEAAVALAPFDVICTIRERMPITASLLARLPKLKCITIIGWPGRSFDVPAATAAGVIVSQTTLATFGDNKPPPSATPELAWAIMTAAVRNFTIESQRVRAGLWSGTAGMALAGKTLGLLGLGHIGQRMARYAKAFDMNIIAWSQNLTAEKAAEHGVRAVSKDELFQQADIVSIHTLLSDRTVGIVTARELGLMKSSAYLVNTSRGPIVVEADLIAALREKRIAGAALDVFDKEPLPADHPFRTLDNVFMTPHLGYVTRETLSAFYSGTAKLLAAYANGAPINVINPDAAAHPRHKS